MNQRVQENLCKISIHYIWIPLTLLFSIFCFFYYNEAISVDGYITSQKELFLYLNKELSQYPNLQYNLTQLGDAFVILSLLSFSLYYTPKIWENIISASLVSLVIAQFLKKLFAIPRPAAVIDNQLFTIVGETLKGHNSFPSGHSITIFTTLTLFFFAFTPPLV